MTNNTVLDPLGYDKFRNDFWESQPLHVERSDSSYFENLLSEEKIKKFVQQGDASFPEVQAINARAAVPVAAYTTDCTTDNTTGSKTVCAQKLMQCYASGATIVVSEVHKKFPALQDLCSQFSRDFRMLCQANAYLSPAGNQGFHSHYDTHDVFVLQVAGRKTFRFYSAGIKLPFTEDTYTPDNKTESELLDEIEVSAGDTLYIPRGIVHDAIADEGEPSLHITLGAFPLVLRDLLQEMVQVAAEGNVEWRTSVDLTQPPFNLAQLYEKSESIFSESVYAEAISRLEDEVALNQSAIQSQSSGSQALPEISPEISPKVTLEAVIVVEQTRLLGIERREGLLKLRLPGAVLRFEAPMSDAVCEILDNKTMRVGDILVLDDEQKLALCQRLVEAGAIALG